MAEHLTRPFTREDGARSKPGTGLGLAIVRRLIEGEGGYLQFAHEGHRFVATLRIPRRDNGRAGTATGRR
jgi:two-component system osmolarity sensor histidine kinase EnvZ